MIRVIFTSIFLAIAINTIAQIPIDSLEAYYPFNATALDYSGNEHDGIVNGPVLTTDRFGNVNSAYLFDGTDDYIEVPDFSSIDESDEITFSIWAKANKKTGNCMLMLYPDDNSDRCVTCAQFKNEVYWDYGDIFNHGRMYLQNQEFDTLWHHYIFTLSLSDSIKQFYKDGELTKSDTGNIGDGIIDKNRSLWIGGGTDENPGNIRFNGVIDDIRIYNKRLDESEVEQLYQETPCIGYRTVYDTTNVMVYDTTEVMVYDTTNVVINDTTEIMVYDTTEVVVYDSVTVSDTLVIDFLVSELESDKAIQIKAYPNPTNNQINIEIGDHELLNKFTLKIINLSGAVLYEKLITKNLITINLNSLGSPGVYFLNISNKEAEISITKKLVLQ